MQQNFGACRSADPVQSICTEAAQPLTLCFCTWSPETPVVLVLLRACSLREFKQLSWYTAGRQVITEGFLWMDWSLEAALRRPGSRSGSGASKQSPPGEGEGGLLCLS